MFGRQKRESVTLEAALEEIRGLGTAELSVLAMESSSSLGGLRWNLQVLPAYWVTRPGREIAAVLERHPIHFSSADSPGVNYPGPSSFNGNLSVARAMEKGSLVIVVSGSTEGDFVKATYTYKVKFPS